MGRLAGKVAFVTGAARGQGRSHAIRLAQEGADIIAIDLCADIDTVPYPLAKPDDLSATVSAIEALGRKVLARTADVRDGEALEAVVGEGVDLFGRLDVVCANAGILSLIPATKMTSAAWRDVIDVNLTGVWNTCAAAMPHVIDGGRGGSFVLTSSTSGLRGPANLVHYAAAKHGVVGVMRVLAKELAPYNIRVNTIHPTIVHTDMVLNDTMYRSFRPDVDGPTLDDALPAYINHHQIKEPWVEPEDVSAMVAFLCSDEARYVTGATMVIDLGQTL